MEETGSDEPGTPGSLAREATRRIDEILRAAEESAAAIARQAEARGEAYAQGRRRAADRLTAAHVEKLRGLAGSLAVRIDWLQRETEAVARAVEEALVELEAAGSRSSQPAEAPETVRLRALQLARAGAERSEIESVLRIEYSVAEPSGLVDDVLASLLRDVHGANPHASGEHRGSPI